MQYADCTPLQRAVVDAYPDQDVAEGFRQGVDLDDSGDTAFIGLVNDADEDMDTLLTRIESRIDDLHTVRDTLNFAGEP